MNTRLAIVILNWNGADMLHKYLPSVINNSKVDGVEVIVADNGSTDNSIELLKTEFPNTRLIQFDRNYGFAEGYNQALRQVEADYYLLLNSDVEIRQKDWIVPMLNYMDSHTDTCACQPKLLKLNNSDIHTFEYAGAAGGFIDRYGYPFCRGRIFDTVEDDHGQYDSIVPLHWATGAALMVRSKDYWAVGGLDGRFFAHMEEIDLCWRMRLNGGMIVCIPESTAFHLGGATLNQGNPRKTFLNFRNNLLMLHKNLPESEYGKVILVRHILDFTAAMKFLLSGDAANMKAVFRATKEFRRIRNEFSRTPQRNKECQSTSPISILWQYYIYGKRYFTQLGE